MGTQRIFGIVLAVGGVIPLTIGINASHRLADRVSDTFTSRFTHATTWFIVGGIAFALIGLLMVQFSGGSKTAVIAPADA